MIEFSGAHVVVTGGTGALGAAVVGALRAYGAVCYLPVRSARGLDEFAWKDDAQVHVGAGVDLTDETAVGEYYQSVPSLWGSIHLAGTFFAAPIENTRAADFDNQFGTNARSCFLCMHSAVAGIRARNTDRAGGRIVNVAARPALEPRAGGGMVVYTGAKAAIAAMTQALAEELVDERIWVNAVAPSTLDTAVNRAANPQADFSRWVSLDTLAQVIAFLASPQNGATRGAVVPVYGGS